MALTDAEKELILLQNRGNVEGFQSLHVDANKKSKSLHKDLPCDYVMLSNWNMADDLTDTNDTPTESGFKNIETSGQDILYGLGGQCVHQLFPGQTTILLPVSNANQVSVRTTNKVNKRRVFFSVFRRNLEKK